VRCGRLLRGGLGSALSHPGGSAAGPGPNRIGEAKSSDILLRGWVLHTDGRLYHAVLGEGQGSWSLDRGAKGKIRSANDPEETSKCRSRVTATPAIADIRHKTKTQTIPGITNRLHAVLDRRFQEDTTRPGNNYGFKNGDASGHRRYSDAAIKRAFEVTGINSPENVARLGKATIHTFRHQLISKLTANGFPRSR